MSLPRKRDIVGTQVSITGYDAVLDSIDGAIEAREQIFICCTPASSLMFAREDPALAAALEAADIVTPDGMGVVYAARLLGEKIKDRVYGPDLMAAQLARSAAAGKSIWLYGGFDDDALAALRGSLLAKYPGLKIAGSHSPPHRALSDEETTTLVQQINNDAPDVVWVGLGSPKQEIWMHDLRDRLAAPVLVGVGAAFDFFAGRVSQAPKWMQKVGLEWLYRVTQDPARLGKRYLLTLPKFVFLTLAQRRRERQK